MTTTAIPEKTDTTPPAISRGRRLRSRITDAALNVVLVGALALFAAGAVVPAATGGTALTVLSGSMTPSLPPGYILVYQPVNADTLKAGDVIAYQPDSDITGGIPITHRVIEVATAGGHTSEVIVQGDANPAADKPVMPGQIIGKMVYYIPFAGTLRLLAFHSGLAWLPDALCGGLIAYGALLWVREAWTDRKRARLQRAATAQASEAPRGDVSAHVPG